MMALCNLNHFNEFEQCKRCGKEKTCKKPKVAIDSCVIIKAIGEEEYSEQTLNSIGRFRKTHRICVPLLAVAEFLYVPFRNFCMTDEATLITEQQKNEMAEWFKILDVLRELLPSFRILHPIKGLSRILSSFGEIRADHSDKINLGLAVVHKCREFLTIDEKIWKDKHEIENISNKDSFHKLKIVWPDGVPKPD